MDQLVSIIVPVYKVEEYLPACVRSIMEQSHRALEIILVDDGSPDSCGAICDDLGKEDSRITVIHKPNGGLSNARNAGMAAAKGDFLMFVDSDDLLPADAVEALLTIAVEKAVPLVIGGHNRFEDQPVIPSEESTTVQIISGVDAMQDMFRNGCAAWARLYRRELHKGILFPVGEINEDEAIVLSLLERCDRVAKTEKIVYHYRCREASITTTSFHQKKLAWVRHCKHNLDYIRKNHPQLENDAAIRYRNSLLWSLTEIALSDGDFEKDIRFMTQELKKERRLFARLPFEYRQDKIRFFVLTTLPFRFYRALIRRKRGQ